MRALAQHLFPSTYSQPTRATGDRPNRIVFLNGYIPAGVADGTPAILGFCDTPLPADRPYDGAGAKARLSHDTPVASRPLAFGGGRPTSLPQEDWKLDSAAAEMHAETISR